MKNKLKIISFKIISKFKIQNFSIILILVAFLLLLFFNFSYRDTEKSKTISINGQKFQVEISKTKKEREAGLSGRDDLCRNCGMVFVFPQKGRYGFWMKEMKFDLDIVWIRDNEIVYIAKNIPQDLKEIIIPEVKTNKVLELNAGTVDELNIKIGDVLSF